MPGSCPLLLACLVWIGSSAELRGLPRLPLDGALDERGADRAPLAAIVLEGSVIEPDGSPAQGALVASSAGGRGVTDHTGRYRVEARVPHDARSVQVSAVSGTDRTLVASASIDLTTVFQRAEVERLVLARGTACSPSWLPTFGRIPGTNQEVRALCVYDDGDGPALFLGGTFWSAGGRPADGIARWDGAGFKTLGSGAPSTLCLAVYDDGGGPALYAGGRFTSAGGVPASHVAKWDGSAWTALAGGVGNGDGVECLTVYDDGGGPALYAGGDFRSANGNANRIAKWDGSSWSRLGSGMDATVSALAVYDDGGGPALFAGGSFFNAGGSPASHVARWDGSSWTALGSGLNSTVTALAVFDDGSGPALHAGGYFTSVGGTSASFVAKWNGSSWAAVGNGTSHPVLSLSAHDDGGGPALFAGGIFTTAGGVPANRIAKWDGTSWTALGAGLGGATAPAVRCLAGYDDGDGPALLAGGNFASVSGAALYNVAAWDGSSWSPLGHGLDGTVTELEVFDDGSGPALHALGRFTSVDGTAANRIAKWDGSVWRSLGSGLSDTSLDLSALRVFDDGTGPALYAGGFYHTAGGIVVNGIGRWSGSSWAALGAGVSANPFTNPFYFVACLEGYDGGGGPRLIAGGFFEKAGGLAANNIAQWDGSSWSTLGSGTSQSVLALAVYDEGSGPALFAGGGFGFAGGVAANSIARWDGTSWSAVGSGTNGGVQALALHDDGSGQALIAGGTFTSAGGVAANRIARWDGATWSPLGSGLDGNVLALAVHDDGAGQVLVAGGSFQTAGGVAANRIARWDGSSWSALGAGMDGNVLALRSFDLGNGPGLLAGGSFADAPDTGDSFLALWACALDTTPPSLLAPDSLFVFDSSGSKPGEMVKFTVTAEDDQDPAPSVECVPPSGSFFPRGTTLVTCTAMDAAGNQAVRQFPVTVELKARKQGL